MVDAAMMVKALKLTELVPSSTGFLPIDTSDVNRPGLPFAGFWEHFADERPQILGLVETSYLHSLDPETRKMRLQQFVSYDLPCIVICRRLEGMDDLIQMAGLPTLRVIYKQTVVASAYEEAPLDNVKHTEGKLATKRGSQIVSVNAFRLWMVAIQFITS
jgi:serine kinase of HPr protein (carbohydrate metabolism regulator)